MSLKDLKQSLKACSFSASLRPSDPQLTTAIANNSRKPPKSSLSKQIACIERFAANLDCTPSGEALPPSLQPSIHHSQGNACEPCHADASEKKKRKALPLSSWRNSQGQCLDRDGSELLAMDDASISEIHGKENVSRRASSRKRTACSLAQAHLENHFDEDVSVAELTDSEAGLFITSQREGLFEPLVLWPPNGQDVDASQRVQVPASINSRLLEHQREGVHFLYNLYRENRGGVLGDDMGLGKTIQTIAFLAAILGKDDFHHSINGDIKCTSMLNPVLIICPTSVLKNWEQEFQAWGAFKVAIYHGIHREVVTSKLESKEVEVILTSFDTFRIHGEYLWETDWECVIIDEAHRLKNEKSQLYKLCTKIRTKRRYGLTGTIMQNKLMDLFNVFDMVAPHCLGTREHFRDFYDEALKQGQRTSAPERLVRIAEERKLHLSKVLQRHSLRRTKSETIGHMMMGKEDNVVFCTMSSLQQRAYRCLLESPDFQSLIKKDLPCDCGSPLTQAECCHRTVPNGIIWSYLHRENPDGCDSCPFCLVLPCLTKLQQVSNHLELIKSNAKDEFDKQKKDEALAIAVLGEDASLIGGVAADESFLGLSDTQHCGKMHALELLLAYWSSQGDKVLLFSYSVRMLDILEKFLIRKAYCFSRLDGSTPQSSRQSIVDDFNNSPSKQVFLISTRAGGLGLNLVSANRVVIFDPNWNPAQDLQAQDRSFRYGQRRHVTVFRLLAAGSLEELVYTRQIYKQQLFNVAVSGNQEKRYFEGVQDSKQYKGELFGISNLFRDLCDKVFTSEIIESHKQRSLRNIDAEKNKLEKVDELSHILSGAGVIYAHRNEDVVNLRTDVNKDSINQKKESTFKQQKDTGLMNKGRTKARHEQVDPPATLKSVSSRETCKHKKVVTNEEVTADASIACKENRFAELAKFKCMDVIEFSKWLLAVSELERRQLLIDYENWIQRGNFAH